MNRIVLSRNFFLDEFTRSETAARFGLDVNVEQDSDTFRNLKTLCEQVLQPARDALGPIFISSGYRPRLLNRAIGGSPNSYHISGLAADIAVSGTSSLSAARWFVHMGLPFDQIIHEFGRWVHVGIARPGEIPRRQALTSVRKDGETHYVVGLHMPQDALKMVKA